MLKKEKSFSEIQEELLKKELAQAKQALEDAYANFENALDPELIDCYIYEVNAVQTRYRFLLRQILKTRQLT